MDRVVIVPRWSGTAESDWYPWLRDRLAAEAPRVAVDVAPLQPAPGAPEIAPSIAALASCAGDDPAALARTLLVGHSVGCQVVARYLASLEPPRGVAGVLLVAAWWWVDRPWDTLRPWVDTPVDAARARRASAAGVDVLLSTDDPFTADHDANRRAWEARAGARVEVVGGARHFNAREEGAVLAAVLRALHAQDARLGRGSALPPDRPA